MSEKIQRQVPKRLRREAQTLAVMVGIYCRGRHGVSDGPCDGCAGLLAYAEERLAKCPFDERKPVCSQCLIHCYEEPMRSEIRAIMRYAGPRMFLRHPVLAFLHVCDRLTHSVRPARTAECPRTRRRSRHGE